MSGRGPRISFANTLFAPAITGRIPLRPAGEGEAFYAVMYRADFLAARDLADVWAEVPALELLEADGLDKVPAKELFDTAVEPQWRAQVNISGLTGRQEVRERVMRVAQGPNSAWMASPIDDAMTKIRVETVKAGALEELLSRYWSEAAA